MATLDRTLLSAAVIALGLTLGGFAVGNGFARARSADRYVTVKGVAEREVRANLAIWPLRVVGADNDLTAANAKSLPVTFATNAARVSPSSAAGPVAW